MSVRDGAWRPPGYVVALSLALASLQPASHLMLASRQSGPWVSSGLYTADSAIYLHCMAMFDTGFRSPYATCRNENGERDSRLFPLPFHWMYGAIGAAGAMIGIDRFIWLGLANGAGAAAYLLAVYAFLRAAVPRTAGLALVLFTLGGGVGGVAFFAALATGAAAPDPPVWLQRAVMYELIEGPYLSASLHTARLYYSLSLAFAFASLAMYWRGIEVRCARRLGSSAVLLFLSALINVRFGAFAWGVAILHALCVDGLRSRERFRYAALLGPAFALAAGVTWIMQARSPVFASNTAALVRESMWLTPLLLAAGPQLALAAAAVVPALRLNSAGVAAWPLAAYLAVFGGLYFGHQVYYGNFATGAESGAAIFASDWALLGGLAGLLAALRSRRRGPKPSAVPDPESVAPGWIVLWLLLYAVVAVSAWGQGWFLQFTPQRLMAFLGVPLSMLAAHALLGMRRKRARAAIGFAILMCGLASIVAGRLFILLPPAFGAVAGAFGRLHPEFISREDAALVDSLGRGVVLAPWDLSDVIALRAETRVIGGAGSTDLSEQKSIELRPFVEAFFNPATPDSKRRGIAEEWCVDFVYCPDTFPVADGTVAALEAARWLRIVAEQGKGVIFEVVR